jgi:Cys-tRNA synthase (O-phospho-L-seryl-tRNA:Cys-tRNA synthase)
MKHRANQSPTERRLRSKLRRLLAEGGIMHASAIVMRRVCGKPNCRCTKGHKHESLYVARRRGGRQYMKCVPKAKEAQVKAWVQRYREVKETVDALSALYWQEFEHEE